MLDATVCQDAYRAELVAAYGRWERAEGSAHAAEEWFRILRDATALESTTVEQMVRLSAFALQENARVLTAEADAALHDPAAPRVLQSCQGHLQEGDLVSPEDARAFFTRLRHDLRDSDGLRGRQVMMPIRAALTVTLVGPCLGIVASLLGYARTRRRLEEWL